MKTTQKQRPVLIYSFSTFPFLKEIETFHPFIFKKLKIDLVSFKIDIDRTKPRLIVGIARSRFSSYFETRTRNVWGRTHQLSQTGPQEFLLHYPAGGYRSIRPRTTNAHSFCNWTMYKISEYVQPLRIPLEFIHINKHDLEDLIAYLSELSNANQ